MGPERSSDPPPASRGVRGRRTAELLGRRELPGEVKAALVCMGLAGGNSLASVVMSLALSMKGPPGWMPDDLWAVGVGHGTFVLAVGALMWGLWRRTGWGYWGTNVLFGLGATGCLLGAFYWFLAPAGIDFFSSPFGLVATLILAGLCVAPVLLLARARRRYFSPPPPDQRSV